MIRAQDAKQTVSFAVRNPGTSRWTPETAVVIEYREHSCIGGDCWKFGRATVAGSDTAGVTELPYSEENYISGEWIDSKSLADGLYDLRVSTKCAEPGQRPAFARTTEITGRIARTTMLSAAARE